MRIIVMCEIYLIPIKKSSLIEENKRNKKRFVLAQTFFIIDLSLSSGDWTRTSDLRVMSLVRTATNKT